MSYSPSFYCRRCDIDPIWTDSENGIVAWALHDGKRSHMAQMFESNWQPKAGDILVEVTDDKVSFRVMLSQKDDTISWSTDSRTTKYVHDLPKWLPARYRWDK